MILLLSGLYSPNLIKFWCQDFCYEFSECTYNSVGQKKLNDSPQSGVSRSVLNK